MKNNFNSLYENLGGTYREENGHLIPNITLPEQTDYQIGKYGRMHLATKSGSDEDLKVRDMLRWVAEMNNIKASAEEIVLREVVYV